MKQITFAPMTSEEYDNYFEFTWANYAEEQIIAGLSKEEAKVNIERTIKELIPDGFKTKHNFFYNIKKEEKTVGYIWIWHNVKNHILFLPEIYIMEADRGRGIGEIAIKFFENKAIELKVQKLKLHVFGHNTNAQNFYKKLGFRPTNVVMEKVLKDDN